MDGSVAKLVEGKNPCYVTAVKPKVYAEAREIHHDWNEGAKFQVYQSEKQITKDDAFRMKLAGFTHVWFVWQDPQQGNRTVASEVSL